MARPIDTAPKTGKVILVGDDYGTIARAFWHTSSASKGGGVWCYPTGEGQLHVIDFTPTRWGENTAEFERD